MSHPNVRIYEEPVCRGAVTDQVFALEADRTFLTTLYLLLYSFVIQEAKESSVYVPTDAFYANEGPRLRIDIKCVDAEGGGER